MPEAREYLPYQNHTVRLVCRTDCTATRKMKSKNQNDQNWQVRVYALFVMLDPFVLFLV